MGQLTIEIPQSVNLHYKIVSEELAEKILSYLEKLVQENKIEEIIETQADREETKEN